VRSLCFVGTPSYSYYLRYKASEIWKLSRKLPADFQELPLPAVTGLVVMVGYPPGYYESGNS
jgi:hypothetical protein